MGWKWGRKKKKMKRKRTTVTSHTAITKCT